MPDSEPKPASDLSLQLLRGWSLGTSSDESPAEVDSLLAPPPVRPSPLTHGRGAGAAGAPGQQPDDHDQVLFRAFTLAGEDDPIDLDVDLNSRPGSFFPEDDESGAGPRLASRPRVPVVFPKTGMSVGGFQLIAELGRGAFARVYLAEQASLGGRLVALKVSRAEGEEPQILARLQHTHIVPIYSVHDEPATDLRLICMPYLGGANLAQVLETAGARLPTQTSGHSLVDALDEVSHRLHGETKLALPSAPYPSRPRKPSTTAASRQASAGAPAEQSAIASEKSRTRWVHFASWRRSRVELPTVVEEADFHQPARQFLREADGVHAAVWIIARLAEGLDHAHSRNLLHRDIKPSNILIAGDGMPMLLDFNLSASIDHNNPAEGARALLGGTLPYMAPEHLDAFDPESDALADTVDERSDLYSLGLILFEMISGEHPFPEPTRTLPLVESIRFMKGCRGRIPSLRAVRPEVPWSLDAIVAKCLDPLPQRRYACARDLAEDLRRFLDDMPMKFAPEPSFRERVQKWARRNPTLCSTTSISIISTIIVVLLVGSIAYITGSLRNASAQLEYSRFEKRVQDCQFFLNTVSGPVDHLETGIKLADETLKDAGLNANGDWPNQSWLSRLSADGQRQVREQVVELTMLEAQAKAYRAGRFGSEADRRAALEWAIHRLERAERFDPRPPSALFGDRARYRAARGDADAAKFDRDREARMPLVSGRDYALKGTSLLASHDLKGAEESLTKALDLDKKSFWTWFALGHCHFEQGRYLEAAGDFNACTVIDSRFAWPEMNRGLALANAGHFHDSLDCYNRALALNSNFAEALVNRALVELELNDPKSAERDLRRAIELGRGDTNVLAALGQVMVRLGHRDEAERLYAGLLKDQPNNTMYLVARGIFRLAANPEGARADLNRALQIQPGNPRAHYGVARLIAESDPRSAVEHLELALDAEPGLIEAFELRAAVRARQGDLSALDDVDRLIKSPTPYRLYNAACALALLSERRPDNNLSNRALTLLAQAIESGYPVTLVVNDPDWKPFRDRPDYQKLIRKATAPAPKKP